MKAIVIEPFRDKNKPDVGYGVGDILDVPQHRYSELKAAGVVERVKEEPTPKKRK